MSPKKIENVSGWTTLAKAKKCPRCHQIGTLVKEQKTLDLTYMGYVYTCENGLCSWAGTNWIVMADDEGKVPMMDIGHTNKMFPKMKDITDAALARLRTTFDDVES